MTLFHVIGLVITSLVALAVIAAVFFYLYVKLIYKRFSWIPFCKTARRMSIASWHATRLLPRNRARDDGLFDFDDFPINERPFFVSCTVGKRRYFVMLGFIVGPRSSVGKGKHPGENPC